MEMVKWSRALKLEVGVADTSALSLEFQAGERQGGECRV